MNSYITSFEFAVKTRVAISNHLEAMQKLCPDNKTLIKMIEKQLKQAIDMENNIIESLENYINKHEELKADYKILLTIPGIGKKSAIYLLTFFKTYPNANRQQITALAGLDVIERSSGTSVSGRKKISKSGNKRIRTILYFPTMNAC